MKGQKVLTTHIGQEYLDIVEAIRKIERGRQSYAHHKELIERVLADAKESTLCDILITKVDRCHRMDYAAMNLKRYAKKVE